jgi:hypothetical protein
MRSARESICIKLLVPAIFFTDPIAFSCSGWTAARGHTTRHKQPGREPRRRLHPAYKLQLVPCTSPHSSLHELLSPFIPFHSRMSTSMKLEQLANCMAELGLASATDGTSFRCGDSGERFALGERRRRRRSSRARNGVQAALHPMAINTLSAPDSSSRLHRV